MLRQTLTPRPNWQERVETLGFDFHTFQGVPYWTEEVCYSFSEAEANQLEAATKSLHDLCLEAVDRLVRQGDFSRLSIPGAFWPWIIASWKRGDPGLYGRFDLAYDGINPPKMLEYNADTPTALLESAVVQWHWLEEVKPTADQFNSIHDKLIAAWRNIHDRHGPSLVHFSGVVEEYEDFGTLEYMRDVCIQAGLETCRLDIEEIGWNGHGFTDLAERPIELLFKLYPWEWLLQEEFSAQLLQSSTQFIEPPWKMLLSTKAILPILWEMFPNHPNLLAASFHRSDFSGACVEKPIHGREGAGIRVLDQADPGQTTDPMPRIWQAYHPLPQFEGNHVLIGSWVVADEPAGICIREDASLITGNDSRLVPHYLDMPRPVIASPGLPIWPPQKPPSKTPWMTFGLTGLLFLIFLVETQLGAAGSLASISPQSLAVLGGLNHDLVFKEGQWFRLLFCIFLHADSVHLLSNSLVLLLAGWSLELRLGRQGLLLLFLLSGLGGSILSAVHNPSNVIAVGASGSIMGLLAAMMVLTFEKPNDWDRLGVQLGLLRLLIPALIPPVVSHIDTAAHVGGAIAGMLLTTAAKPALETIPPALPKPLVIVFFGIIGLLVLIGLPSELSAAMRLGR